VFHPVPVCLVDGALLAVADVAGELVAGLLDGVVVGRPDLPDLLRPRDARPRPLPRLRSRPAAARTGHRRHAGDLLMDSGVLPRVDRQILLYQRWLTERLAAIEDPEHHRLLRHFATWHQMRRLRATAAKRPLGRAKQETTQAGAFLTWLADRGRTIEHCRQADLDAWHTEKPATRRPAQTFLRWCMRTGRMPRLTLPPQVITQDQAPLPQHRRLAMLRRVLNELGGGPVLPGGAAAGVGSG
ncbi:hypothetical protein ACFCYB_34560, partial [Streptomyces sp. NPDC056309]